MPVENLFFRLEYTLISRELKTSQTLAIFLGERPSIWNSPIGENLASPWLIVNRLETSLGILGLDLRGLKPSGIWKASSFGGASQFDDGFLCVRGLL